MNLSRAADSHISYARSPLSLASPGCCWCGMCVLYVCVLYVCVCGCVCGGSVLHLFADFVWVQDAGHGRLLFAFLVLGPAQRRLPVAQVQVSVIPGILL